MPIEPLPIDPVEGYEDYDRHTRAIWYYTRPQIPNLTGPVLDVGSGDNPHPQATTVCDLYPADSKDRDQPLVVPKGIEFVQGDVQRLPFADNSFSFVFCQHLLEHVDDPVAACAELQRVASTGLIETPHAVLESCYDTPSHRWLVDLVDGVLVFVPKTDRGNWRRIPHPRFPLHIFPQVVGFDLGYVRALWTKPFKAEVRNSWA